MASPEPKYTRWKPEELDQVAHRASVSMAASGLTVPTVALLTAAQRVLPKDRRREKFSKDHLESFARYVFKHLPIAYKAAGKKLPKDWDKDPIYDFRTGPRQAPLPEPSGPAVYTQEEREIITSHMRDALMADEELQLWEAYAAARDTLPEDRRLQFDTDARHATPSCLSSAWKAVRDKHPEVTRKARSSGWTSEFRAELPRMVAAQILDAKTTLGPAFAAVMTGLPEHMRRRVNWTYGNVEFHTAVEDAVLALTAQRAVEAEEAEAKAKAEAEAQAQREKDAAEAKLKADADAALALAEEEAAKRKAAERALEEQRRQMAQAPAPAPVASVGGVLAGLAGAVSGLPGLNGNIGASLLVDGVLAIVGGIEQIVVQAMDSPGGQAALTRAMRSALASMLQPQQQPPVPGPVMQPLSVPNPRPPAGVTFDLNWLRPGGVEDAVARKAPEARQPFELDEEGFDADGRYHGGIDPRAAKYTAAPAHGPLDLYGKDGQTLREKAREHVYHSAPQVRVKALVVGLRGQEPEHVLREFQQFFDLKFLTLDTPKKAVHEACKSHELCFGMTDRYAGWIRVMGDACTQYGNEFIKVPGSVSQLRFQLRGRLPEWAKPIYAEKTGEQPA